MPWRRLFLGLQDGSARNVPAPIFRLTWYAFSSPSLSNSVPSSFFLFLRGQSNQTLTSEVVVQIIRTSVREVASLLDGSKLYFTVSEPIILPLTTFDVFKLLQFVCFTKRAKLTDRYYGLRLEFSHSCRRLRPTLNLWDECENIIHCAFFHLGSAEGEEKTCWVQRYW